MAHKRGLGSGLDNLIPEYLSTGEVPEKVEKAVTTISINDIEPNRAQPRKNFDEEKLTQLADSIKQHGIIEPIVVQKKGKRFEIIAGERRFRAARIAGITEVPVVIRDFADADVFVIALLENIQREDLNPIEEAMAYQKMVVEHNLNQEEVAAKVSKKRTTITNSMRLLKLPQEIIDMVAQGSISEGHGRALLGLEKKEEQIKLANRIINENLSVRDIERMVKALKEGEDNPQKKKTVKTAKVDAVYKEYENKLKTSLGAKVEIKKKDDKSGKIEINYYSIAELEVITELITSIGKDK